MGGKPRVLAPSVIVEAANLMREGGDLVLAAKAYEAGETRATLADVRGKALAGLTRCHDGLEAWPEVILTAKRYLEAYPAGEFAAELYFFVARAHRALDDPFVTLQALAQSRERSTSEGLSARCDLMEGRLYAALGDEVHAAEALSRAGHATTPSRSDVGGG